MKIHIVFHQWQRSDWYVVGASLNEEKAIEIWRDKVRELYREWMDDDNLNPSIEELNQYAEENFEFDNSVWRESYEIRD